MGTHLAHFSTFLSSTISRPVQSLLNRCRYDTVKNRSKKNSACIIYEISITTGKFPVMSLPSRILTVSRLLRELDLSSLQIHLQIYSFFNNRFCRSARLALWKSCYTRFNNVYANPTSLQPRANIVLTIQRYLICLAVFFRRVYWKIILVLFFSLQSVYSHISSDGSSSR